MCVYLSAKNRLDEIEREFPNLNEDDEKILKHVQHEIDIYQNKAATSCFLVINRHFCYQIGGSFTAENGLT